MGFFGLIFFHKNAPPGTLVFEVRRFFVLFTEILGGDRADSILLMSGKVLGSLRFKQMV
jgi:hypothetical protein